MIDNDFIKNLAKIQAEAMRLNMKIKSLVVPRNYLAEQFGISSDDIFNPILQMDYQILGVVLNPSQLKINGPKAL